VSANKKSLYDTIGIAICGGLIALVLLLIMQMIVNSVESKEYARKCINAGGVYIAGKELDVCVKEFFPLSEEKK